LRSSPDEAAEVFSDFLRSLEPGRQPDPERLREVLAALERLLRLELRRRGLWHLPPVRLGLIGYASWREPGALTELAADAYGHVLLRRMRGLLAQLRVKPQIEGLVRLNVQHFLRDLQHGSDPLGYRAWEVAQNAVERAVERKALAIAADGPPVDAGTLLATVPAGAAANPGVAAADPGAAAAATPEPAGEVRHRHLAARAALWNAELLPELVTAGGRGLDPVIDRLAERLPELAADGVARFRLRELVAALRDDLRRQWAARLWRAGDEAPAGEVRTGAGGGAEPPVPVLLLSPQPADPEQTAAERDALRRLHRCTEQGLERLAGDERERRETRALWRALATAAVEEDGMPSQRQLAQALGIPRGRMPELFRRVGEVMARCRRELGLAREVEVGR
jgi:hypothetical protein